MVSEFNNWNIEIMAQELALSLKDQAVSVLADLDFSHRMHYTSYKIDIRRLVRDTNPDVPIKIRKKHGKG